jgi:hypothetical protein
MNESLDVESLDVESLLKLMDDEKSEYLMGLTTKKLKAFNKDVLKRLKIGKPVIKDFMQKLEGYKCVDELAEIKYGKYVRWISLKDEPENMKLVKGGIVCELNIGDTGTIVTCKNFLNKYFKFILDECVVFQKLTAQEVVLMTVLDQL